MIYSDGSVTLNLYGIYVAVDWHHSSTSMAIDLNASMRQAIADRDPVIFDVFDYVESHKDEIQQMSFGVWCLDRGWEYIKQGGPDYPRQYKEALATLKSNQYLTNDLKYRVDMELAHIAAEEEKVARKQREAAAKRGLMRKRRNGFSQKRAALMLALIDRGGYQCSICDCQDDLTIDHIVPLSRGGTDDLDNLRLLCRSCNSSKGDRAQQETA